MEILDRGEMANWLLLVILSLFLVQAKSGHLCKVVPIRVKVGGLVRNEEDERDTMETVQIQYTRKEAV
jgi:hypothetical protein